jgi:hypothetical protein
LDENRSLERNPIVSVHSHTRSRQLPRRVALIAVVIVALAGLLLGMRVVAAAGQAASESVLTADDMQQMIFVWASGTAAVQDLAQEDCAQLHLSATQCAAMSADVRQAWLALMQRDPASVGRVGVAPHPAARAAVLRTLATQLGAMTRGQTRNVIAVTRSTFAVIRDPRWARHVATVYGRPIVSPTMPQNATTKLIWATSFFQPTLPNGLDPNHSPYVALPDNYLKYADWGMISSIPAIYQPYYAPNGATAHWTVTLSTPDRKHIAAKVPITDVGPWNEDDNWWDPNGISATPPSNCPVANTLIAPDASGNPLVNGVCPDGHNLRRLYYYLLYQHGGLPFFQSSSYHPSGTFADGSAWPAALPRYCSETTAASINDDGMTCGDGANGYNGNNGSWLREADYDTPILNQSSIDLGPAADVALGWTYPSSGLVLVDAGRLP